MTAAAALLKRPCATASRKETSSAPAAPATSIYLRSETRTSGMALKIKEVKTATVVGNYHWTYVRIYAGDEYGTGEGFFAPGLEEIVREMGRLLIGEDALEMTRLCEKLHWASVPSGTQGSNYHALSAMEIALLDLAGKHLNVPVYTLLGGKYRDRIR